MKSISFDTVDEVLEIERTWLKRMPEGTETKVHYFSKKRPVRAAEVEIWLLKHGFSVLELFGNREEKPYSSESNRAIFWAKKKM